ncbi:MAG: amidohydrolase [Anaerolineae bacterium]|nr:amidohydrolase [Anaerolineae bacterium]
MIIDAHCHAWTYWPYRPPVPDPEHRGRVEQLLHEMDINGVDQAVVICAQIDHNPDNNAYIAQQAAKHPARLHQFADVDSFWSPTYHQPGAADRLRQIAGQWPVKGFTHYLADEDDGAWLYGEEGLAFFRAAAELGLIASIACQPHHQRAIRKVAERFPETPILCHHLGMVKAGDTAALTEVLESARLPNIYIKLSGFAYSTRVQWEYPYSDAREIVRAEYEHFGPRRMCWGSDYPVVRFFMTYRQAIEAFRTHCAFVPDADKAWILGQTLGGLLGVSARADLL